MFTLMSIVNENVPLFDVTVKVFIIGFFALLAAVWLGFYIFDKFRTRF